MFKLNGFTTLFMSAILALWSINVRGDLTLDFYRISSNSSVNVASDLSVTVSPVSGSNNQAAFTFTNSGDSSICDIYFDDGTLLGISSIYDSGDGVAFLSPATPWKLSGQNDATTPFITTKGFSANSDSPVEHNGMTQGEWVTIVFNLIDDKTFSDTLSALGDGSLRIGLHVQNIGPYGNDSDSYVNMPPVPTPVAIVLGLIGLGCVGWAKRRFS